jgi:uncharacterized protein
VKIAIVGTGISGLTAAYFLHREHEVTIFEKETSIGGHTATIDVTHQGRQYAIDTGFIVYNDWTYPNFIRLMSELGVDSQATEMSFSVSCDKTGLEYAGNNLNTLFAQRRNLLNPSYLKMLADIVKFNKSAIDDLDHGRIRADITLGEYLKQKKLGSLFAEKYLIPMGSAIWSASTQTLFEFPLQFFVRFLKNHGLLNINHRPEWRVIKGGSREYLTPLTRGYKNRIETGARVESVSRTDNHVDLVIEGEKPRQFDQVVFACHSDEALAILNDASDAELSVLGAMDYQQNDVVLHTDENLLPNKKLAWSSWNYWLRTSVQESAVLTYNMNILQGIKAPTTFCVTLNATDAIKPNKIIAKFQYGHPVFTLQSVAAVERWGEINGVNNSWFCGAYWGNGFHEDGVKSGLQVAKALGSNWE